MVAKRIHIHYVIITLIIVICLQVIFVACILHNFTKLCIAYLPDADSLTVHVTYNYVVCRPKQLNDVFCMTYVLYIESLYYR